MKKKLLSFTCPYCSRVMLNGTKGYGNHMRAAHPQEYAFGLKNYKGSCKDWPFIPFDAIHSVTSVILNDEVHHPKHYTSSESGIECIDAIQAALTEEEFRGFCKGNALKYVWREKLKGKDTDLQKANWYLSRLT